MAATKGYSPIPECSAGWTKPNPEFSRNSRYRVPVVDVQSNGSKLLFGSDLVLNL
ncbi:MAG: hypothetical protein JWQ19_577 [Subtercola sp.]|nr:hypothetical protein [Subtercola sp.]